MDSLRFKTFWQRQGRGLMCLAAMMLIPGTLCAETAPNEPYVVQLAAYSKAASSEEVAKLSENFFIKQEDAGGVKRLLAIGYGTRKEAEAAQSMLRDMGYIDAFVRRASSSDGEASTSYQHEGGHNHHHGGDHQHLSHSLQQQLDSLSAEERQYAVILDGRLHLKRGETFVPVE